MITRKFNQTLVTTAERTQSDHLGRRLSLAGTDYQTPTAPFDGDRV